MTDLPAAAISLVIPILLSFYALAFVAGGVYMLEQRVARVRDQLPRHGPLARLTGFAALGIGVLATTSVAGYLIRGGIDHKLGALVATTSGIGFWIARIHAEMTTASRIRDGLLAIACALLTLLTGWWVGFS